MSEKIEPALSADEWAEVEELRDPLATACTILVDLIVAGGENAAAIALGNHLLSDDDPRKITREKIALLRAIVENDAFTQGDQAPAGPEMTFLDALESYLPPVLSKGGYETPG